MKKVKFLLMGILVVFCFTGCGGKKLVCSQSKTEDGMKQNVEVTINFDGEKASKVKMDMGFEATTAEAKEQFNESLDFLDEIFIDSFKNTPGITASSKTDKNKSKYSYTMEIDLKKISKDVADDLDMDEFTDASATYDSIKKSAEEEGFTCK